MFDAEVWAVVGQAIAALGGGAVVVAALSSWIGKVWADRLMARQRQAHETALGQLKHDSELLITQARAQLDLAGQVHYHEYTDKIAVYRAAIDIIADSFVDIEAALQGGNVSRDTFEQLERRRFRVHGYLGMVAPQEVMTKLDTLMDYILDVREGTVRPDFAQARGRAYNLLNAIRVDVALNKEPIEYSGHR